MLITDDALEAFELLGQLPPVRRARLFERACAEFIELEPAEARRDAIAKRLIELAKEAIAAQNARHGSEGKDDG